MSIMSNFTKWVECVPLPSQTAEVTARAAINDFLSRFSYHFEIFTVQGRNSFVRFVRCWESTSPGQLPIGLLVMVK